ncbi:ParB/RepB/Spo0J family partition protein [Neptunicoccus cionae]|uniref:ParB-like N-terminal domain-containing protein n=1 Tax=Neptunicoccus cionae TaxID=2035344 RepID=A0A916R2Q5_9RHOB|nr:ParB/RepB/Spo0J family partition protein [Amylibacter cionae]GGA29601.1 hypothetical protein GCM10011498_33480 [Amylibacter cionae]
MARKRLAPAKPDFLTQDAPAPDTTSAPEAPRMSGPPIAQVAAEASAHNALQGLAEDISRARAAGKMILDIPLEDIAPDHLARDRIRLDGEEMKALMDSILRHGQRTPIEVMEIEGSQKYGLISGWRRLMALEFLRKDNPNSPQFATVQALLRKPDASVDAYVAMVEENEIRVGLSYYERASVAAEAVKHGVFETEKQALLSLFATASRPKRSRIRSFIEIYHALGDVLCFPGHIPERLGLSLVEGLRRDPELADRIERALQEKQPTTPDAELAVLAPLAAPPKEPKPATAKKDAPVRQKLGNGLEVSLKQGRIEIRGENLDEKTLERVVSLLEQESF